MGAGGIIELPWPPKELTPNFKRRHHWRTYQRPTKLYREACYVLTKAAGLRAPKGGRVNLTIAFYPPDRRRRDDDGMIGAFKAGRDGMADALGTDDHNFRASYAFGEPVKGGKVVVTLEAAA